MVALANCGIRGIVSITACFIVSLRILYVSVNQLCSISRFTSSSNQCPHARSLAMFHFDYTHPIPLPGGTLHNTDPALPMPYNLFSLSTDITRLPPLHLLSYPIPSYNDPNSDPSVYPLSFNPPDRSNELSDPAPLLRSQSRSRPRSRSPPTLPTASTLYYDDDHTTLPHENGTPPRSRTRYPINLDVIDYADLESTSTPASGTLVRWALVTNKRPRSVALTLWRRSRSRPRQ